MLFVNITALRCDGGNMYTMEQAKEIVRKGHPGFVIENSFDYKDRYIFSILPENFDKKRDGGFLDGFYSVNKETGEMLGFAPWEETDFLEQTTDMSVWD